MKFTSKGKAAIENFNNEELLEIFARYIKTLSKKYDIEVDVPVARMTEARDLQTMLFLQPCRELEQILQPAPWNDNILIELRQSRVAQGIGEFSTNLPDGFTFFIAKTTFDEQWLLLSHNFFDGGNLSTHGVFLSVQLTNQMRFAAEQTFTFGAFGGGGKREFIRQFQRAWQKTGGKNGLQCADRGAHGIKTDGQIGPERRERNQF